MIFKRPLPITAGTQSAYTYLESHVQSRSGHHRSRPCGLLDFYGLVSKTRTVSIKPRRIQSCTAEGARRKVLCNLPQRSGPFWRCFVPSGEPQRHPEKRGDLGKSDSEAPGRRDASARNAAAG